MKTLKIVIPSLMLVTALAGLYFRKFLWCNVLLPLPGEPMGAGDLFELFPIALLLLLSGLALIVGLVCLAAKRFRDIKYGLFILLLSLGSVPIYYLIHSAIKPICHN